MEQNLRNLHKTISEALEIIDKALLNLKKEPDYLYFEGTYNENMDRD